MPKSSSELLQHILVECHFIEFAVSPEITKDRFLQDEILKRAIVRSLEIIGEATKQIPIDDKLKFPNIEWKSMAGMRDRLIHDYMGVNYNIVWDVAKNKIPQLKLQIGNELGNSSE